MPDTFTARIIAAVDRAERVAHETDPPAAAWELVPRSDYIYGNVVRVVGTNWPHDNSEPAADGGDLGDRNATHVAAWSPAAALRHVQHARDVLTYVDRLRSLSHAAPTTARLSDADMLEASLAAAWGVTDA